MTLSDRSVLVLYGSETGNAQDMADELGRLCQRLRFRTHVDELDSIDLNSLLKYQLVIFVLSTTGQGDMPHNSLLFWKKLLRKKLPPTCLSQMKYTCFGLGDSTYLKFNWAARKLVRRLEQLGACSFIDGFEADEQFNDGIEGAFNIWADGLYQYLLTNYPHPAGFEPIPDGAILPPRWSLSPALNKDHDRDAIDGVSAKQSIDSPSQFLALDTDTPPIRLLPIPDGWTASIIESKRMTPESHWQDVRLISFDIPCLSPGEKLQINPGDCLTIYPKNFPQDVEKLIDLMEWGPIADQLLDLSHCPSLPRGLHAPNPCTLRTLLLENIDFTTIPRRSFLKNMSYFSSDQTQKDRLLEFTKTEFLDEYFDYATRSRRTILEVLEEFHSVKLPADRLLDIFPLIRGRDFSIANGGAHLTHPSGDTTTTRVQLLVAFVRYRTILRKPRQGLCSRYLASLPINSLIRVSHKPVLSPIHGLRNAQRPLVAIATGTGIAPVRSLIHERLTHPDPDRAPMLLFFGNRNHDKDFFFKEEWEKLICDEKLTVFTAFSRDQEKKNYVQNVVRQEVRRLDGPLSENAIFTVCGGSTKMADACKEAVFEDRGDREKALASVTWWQEIW